MKVDIDGSEYRVSWIHRKSEEDDGVSHVTECEVKPLDESGSINLNGKALCCVKDHFQKQRGRKISLSRAIQDLDKSFRKLFWLAYDREIGLSR